MGVVSLVRSTWALSYAALSITNLLLTGTAITGMPAKNRTANVVLSILNNQMSELPLTVIILDIVFSFWLNITGTTRASAMVRFFDYVNVISAVGLLFLFKRSFDAKEAVDKFLGQLSKESRSRAELPGLTSPRFWSELLKPFHRPQNCIVYSDIPYCTPDEQLMNIKTDGSASILEMSLDIYRPDSVEGGDDRPVFVYIHGGSWTSGSKSLTGPLVTELISRKWIVVSVDYRLHSKAGYPTQLIDCKRALRWIKDEIRVFGGNPNNVIVGGDSAGGQLAAMLAMTPNEPEFQPGFENVDTSVQGCVPQSAALDLTDSRNYSHHDARGRFIKEVARREGGESPENLKLLSEHSPMYKIKESGVPFLVVHGEFDNLTPVQVARDFAHKFQTQSNAPLSYLEIPGGHHCFHVFSSPRSWYTVIGTAEWLSYNFDHYRNQTSPTEKKKQVNELVEWGWPI